MDSSPIAYANLVGAKVKTLQPCFAQAQFLYRMQLSNPQKNGTKYYMLSIDTYMQLVNYLSF